MPRTGRLHIPGGCYHLIGRGLERRALFEDPIDKQDFLDRLGKNLDRTQCQCLAWALMSNHYHLLVRVGPLPLAKLMAPVLGGYGGYYNRRHRRSGYVFQNRFKSILCQEDSYLLELIRYIHLNPIRAAMVRDLTSLNGYSWTGHAGMLGRLKQSWHDTHAVLELFGNSYRAARKQYLEFMKAGVESTDPRNLSGGGLVRSIGSWEALSQLRKEHVHCIGDERILGDSSFVVSALKEDRLGLDQATLRSREGWTLDKLIHRTCGLCEIAEQGILNKARSNNCSRAKALVCFWGTIELGLTTTEIAQRLQISQQAVSNWIKKGQYLVETSNINFPDPEG
jgi:REP element-mobilizing transposase RayT